MFKISNIELNRLLSNRNLEATMYLDGEMSDKDGEATSKSQVIILDLAIYGNQEQISMDRNEVTLGSSKIVTWAYDKSVIGLKPLIQKLEDIYEQMNTAV